MEKSYYSDREDTCTYCKGPVNNMLNPVRSFSRENFSLDDLNPMEQLKKKVIYIITVIVILIILCLVIRHFM
jgi:hypothetical protein